ncbi:hypothetical protein [Saccharothrix xinjiangensis]|uniref:Uncharacterized protein n=1 Tax=Saccharothrix xinjiangensis TaxID=204798 RepID=A0ABV9XT04_9PSEU
MTLKKNQANTDIPSTVHPVVFSHPSVEGQVVPRRLRDGVQLPRFEGLPVFTGA